MLKKRIQFLAGAVLTAVSFFGCSKISLTDEQNDMIAEYLAGVILRNEQNYTEKLVTPTPIPSPTPSPVPTGSPVNPSVTPEDTSSGTSGNTQASADYTQVVGAAGLKFTYQGYELKKELFDGVINLGEKDKQLLLISFEIENTTEQPITLNLGSEKIQYQLDFGSGKMERPMLTFLDNDLRFMDLTIKAKSKETGVVIFSVKEDQDLSRTNLIISKDSLTAIVELKK